jgi:hypothetical protein
MQAGYCTAWRAEEHRANLPIPLRAMRDNVRANRNYFRTRGGEAEMPEMWEQEDLGCARSRLRGDIKKELRAHWIAARALCGRRSRSRLAITCALPLPSIAFQLVSCAVLRNAWDDSLSRQRCRGAVPLYKKGTARRCRRWRRLVGEPRHHGVDLSAQRAHGLAVGELHLHIHHAGRDIVCRARCTSRCCRRAPC